MILSHFKRRGLPDKVLTEAYHKTLSLERKSLPNPKKSEPQKSQDDDRVILVTTYNPGSVTPMDVIKHNWPLLTKDLYENKMVRGYRRCKNVKDYLVRVRVPDLDKPLQKTPYLHHDTAQNWTKKVESKVQHQAGNMQAK